MKAQTTFNGESSIGKKSRFEERKRKQPNFPDQEGGAIEQRNFPKSFFQEPVKGSFGKELSRERTSLFLFIGGGPSLGREHLSLLW